MVGLWGKVDFKRRDFLLKNRKELFVLVAKLSAAKRALGSTFGRLVGSKKAADVASAQSEKVQMDSTMAYGAPEGSGRIVLVSTTTIPAWRTSQDGLLAGLFL